MIRYGLSIKLIFSQNGFMVLQLTDIEKTLMNLVKDAKETLGVNDNDAIILLRHYKWNLEKLQEQWFSVDTTKLLRKIGVEFDPTLPKSFPYINGTLKAHN